MPFTASARRAARARKMASHLRKLATVDVQPTPSAAGLIITVAVRKPAADPTQQAGKAGLLEYIRPWWSTIERIGLRGTVLVSGWSVEDLSAIETERIRTVSVRPGSRHIFHERHFLVRQYLTTIDDPYVFVTDGSDIAFKRDPFELVKAAGRERRLFVGREKHRILFCKCVRQEMKRQFGKIWYPFRPVLNPGILGGRREIVLEALDCICRLIDSLGRQIVASDMCIINRALYSTFARHELVTGYPLHSRFKGWEFETTAAILHK